MDIENFIDDDLLEQTVENAPVKRENVLSFNNPKAVEPKKTNSKYSGYKMIVRSEIIDKFTTKRTRVVLTPSVCEVCAFDIAKEKHGGWEGVPDFKKADVLQAVIEHKREAHPVKEDLIIDGEDMPTNWLGNNTIL